MNNLIKLLPKRIYTVGYTLSYTYKDESDNVNLKVYDEYSEAHAHYQYLKQHLAFRQTYDEAVERGSSLFALEPYFTVDYVGTKFNPENFPNTIDNKYDSYLMGYGNTFQGIASSIMEYDDEGTLRESSCYSRHNYPLILVQLIAVWNKTWWTNPITEYPPNIVDYNVTYSAIFDFLYTYFNEVDEQDVHPDIIDWLKSNPY